MLPTDVLVGHHEQLRVLLRRLSASTTADAAERRRVLAALAGELTLHERIEDDIYYPTARRLSALVPIAHAEHRQMDDQVVTLLRTDPAGDRFAVELGVLAAALEHHAGKEETDMFPEVAAKLDDPSQQALGAQLAHRLDRLRSSPATRLQLRAKWEVLHRL